MLKLFVTALLIGATFSAWVGEEYWTTVGFSGQLLAGKTTADFARVDEDTDNNLFVAFWMTRSRYPGEHFESFGFASVRPDGRVCGWFAGLNKEPVEVCGGFRVLSIPPHRRGGKVFEWVHSYHADFRSTVGFHDHRIGKLDTANGNGNLTYGDAKPREKSFSAVQVGTPDVISLETNSYDYNYVSLLRLMVEEVPPVRHAGQVEERREEPDRERERIERERAERERERTERDKLERERVDRERTERERELRARETSVQSPRRNDDIVNSPVHQVVGRAACPNGKRQRPCRNRNITGDEVTVLIEKHLIRDQYGNYYEKRIVDGRAYYYPYDNSQLTNAIVNPSPAQRARLYQIGQGVTSSEHSQSRVNPRHDVARIHTQQRQPDPRERSSIGEGVRPEERDTREENYRIGLGASPRDDRRSLSEDEE